MYTVIAGNIGNVYDTFDLDNARMTAQVYALDQSTRCDGTAYVMDDDGEPVYEVERMKWLSDMLYQVRELLMADPNHIGALDEMTMHTNGFAEPGYDSEDIVVIADWNKESYHNPDSDDTMVILGDVLEKMEGFDPGYWVDEWKACENDVEGENGYGPCGKLFRTTADSYSWQRYDWDTGDSDICGDCVTEESDVTVDYLNSLEGNHHRCVSIEGIDPEEHGYFKVNDEPYANGFYGGQDASPQVIAESLMEQGVTRFLFVIDSVGQFDCHFSVFIHEDERELFDEERFAGQKQSSEDPAVAMERGLRAVSVQSADLRAAGAQIVISTVNNDGTAESAGICAVDSGGTVRHRNSEPHQVSEPDGKLHVSCYIKDGVLHWTAADRRTGTDPTGNLDWTVHGTIEDIVYAHLSQVLMVPIVVEMIEGGES